jgi:hypothetical protein
MSIVTAFSSFSKVMALTGQTSTQAPQKVHFSSTTAIPSFMLNAPKGQAGIHDSHPVQVSLLINNLAIRFSSFYKER